MLLLVDNQNIYKTDVYMPMIEKVIKTTLQCEDFTDDVEISISFVSNEEIQKLNKQFRQIDKPTDVLSFPLIDFDDDYDESKLHMPIALGDIVISIEMVEKQAREYNHSFERELGFMFAHSMLHLLGYDHIEKEDETIMNSKQEDILQKVGLFR